jgi:hypothetical protein
MSESSLDFATVFVQQKHTSLEERRFYEAAGFPTSGFLPGCGKPFANTCVHGIDGRYYCSQECADAARKIDLSHVEKLKFKRR